MAIEETLDRLATNIALLTGAVATLSESVNGKYAGKPIYGQTSVDVPPARGTSAEVAAASEIPGVKSRSGRGRPAKGEDQPAAPAAAAAAPTGTIAQTAVEADPFATAAPQPAPERTYTKDDVAAAGRALGATTTQENAVAVMKAATGVGSFGALLPEHYGKAVKAFEEALSNVKGQTAAPAADPFGAAPAAPLVAEDHPSEADLKKAALETQKRCSEAQITPVLVAHGGVKATPQGNTPSLKEVPVANRAKLIAAFKALPSSK